MFKNILTCFIFLVTYPIFAEQAGENISGIVVDDRNNQPIVGANILVVNTDVGTVSDERGEFSLEWSGPYPLSLQVSHIAYQSMVREIAYSGRFSIRLRAAVLKGQEVTIMGTRTAGEKDVSSRTEIVFLRNTEERGVRDISEVLQEMEGVNIAITTTGRQTVSIRGSNANEVSVYLDGVKLNRSMDGETNLAFVDLSDLYSVEVIRGGATTLFGAGNFGGVILLHSGILDHNYVRFSRTVGLTHPDDQDLSAALSFKGGPLSLGGRFSGKSRLYDGRTLYTTLFENYSVTYDTGKLSGTARLIQQENTIQFASGSIISADKMDVKHFNLSGDILFTKGWDFQWGRRDWSWNDNFFTTLNRSLQDSSSTLRLSKTFAWRNLNGTLQVEEEKQFFFGDQQLTDSYSTRNWTDVAQLEQQDRGWAGVIRFQQEYPVPDINMLRLEFGLRRSESAYTHDQEINVYDSTTFVEKIRYQFDDITPLNTFRLGLFAEGRMASGNRFELFFNQGTNHRVPTLNDRFLWGIGLEKMEDYYADLQRQHPTYPAAQAAHDLRLQELKLVLSSMKGGLKREYVSTTELSAKMIFDQLYTKPFTSWEIGVGIFRNSYLDKIAYRIIPNSLVAPFNTTTAWLNGMELSGRTFAWNNQFQITMNMMWVFPSDALVFPDKPGSLGNVIVDLNKDIFHLNLSYLFRGPQKYIRGGVLLDQQKSFSNTNLALSVHKRFWKLNFSLSWAVRNLFSETSVVVDANNISQDGSFNYYDAYRQLLTFKMSLAEKGE